MIIAVKCARYLFKYLILTDINKLLLRFEIIRFEFIDKSIQKLCES